MCLFKVVQVGTIDNLQFTIAYYCNNNLFRLYKWVQSRMQQFYKWVLLQKDMAVLQMGITATTIYSRCTTRYNRECSSFTSGYYCRRTWLFYKWVLQQQQFILVVQQGTIENAAVLQVGITAWDMAVLQVGITATTIYSRCTTRYNRESRGITAQKHGLFYKRVLQRNLLSDNFRY